MHGTLHIVLGQDVRPGEIAERYKVPGLEDRRFNHGKLWSVLEPYVSSDVIRMEVVGRSLQDREIRALHFGEGRTKVLLWSQMHGDESTATMALADVTRFFVEGGGQSLREHLREKLSIAMVPMLNPDGAENFTRRNAIGVDLNRDARRLATPEARALKSLRDRFDPDFGFNLHDQCARVLAGPHGRQVAIAILAPAADEARSYGEVRRKARLVAASIVRSLEPEIGEHIAKYDDTFSPRAFGDMMQAWGVSTVLIESGAMRDDPQKQRLRAINVMAILEALDAIAAGSYLEADVERYEALPENFEIDHDVILRGGKVVFGNGPPIGVDVGIWFLDPVARKGARLGDVGDLAETPAMESVDVSGLLLEVETFGEAPGRLEHGAPVVVTIRSEGNGIVNRFGSVPR